MLYAFPMDRTGCGFYRMVWPLSAVRDATGLEATIVFPNDETPLLADVGPSPDGSGVVVHGVELPSDATGVWMQRPTSRLLVDCISLIQEAGVPVLVDVDDDLAAISPRHASYAALQPSKQPGPGPLHSAAELKRACDLADVVTCSTPALLARYAGGEGGKGILLRNRLRSDWASCLEGRVGGACGGPSHTEPRVGPRLGWPGVITTHPDDLAPLNRALPLLSDIAPTFTIVGPKPEDAHGGIKRASNLLGLPPSAITFTGSSTFADWLPTIAAHLDVAAVPLEPNAFNEAKSWLKPLELSACGVPFVRSSTPEYDALGAGIAADGDHRSWRRHLRGLLSSPDLRDEERSRNRAIAEANTYAAFADEWAAALSPFMGAA